MWKALIGFARKEQACRYGEVSIPPVVQRRKQTKLRCLAESESWEALNEAWAVFVSLAIWTQLEVQYRSEGSIRQQRQADQRKHCLEVAFQEGEIRGDNIPEDPDER